MQEERREEVKSVDVYCQKCGEPWDVFSLHDIDREFADGRRRFLNGEGCPACRWGENASEEPPARSVAMRTAREVLGDDVDGMAAVIEDLKEGAL
jgi:ssDNA-binding Zn-finger/Zn-ribbon topoisomerase 1